MVFEHHDVIVIGAGHNGLIAATYLARAGRDVLVLEAAPGAGGSSSGDAALLSGYRVSPCAYHLHLLQSRVAEDLALFEHGLRVVPIDPSYVSPFEDGRVLIQWRDVVKTQQEIAKFSARDAERYPQWLQFWTSAGEILDPYTLNHHPPTIADLERDLSGTAAEDTLGVLVNWTPRELLDHYFESEQVQAALMPNSDTHSLDEAGELLGWAMTAPNRGARRQHQGVPIGGMGAFGNAVLAAAMRAGVEVRVNCAVSKIEIEDGRARGVRLHDGTFIMADTVVSNADPKRTFTDLIERTEASAAAVDAVQRLDTDSGSLKFHAAVSELPDFRAYLGEDHDPRLLSMIRISPSTSYVAKSLADAAAGRPTESPVLIVMIPTVLDPSVAPDGHHLVSVRVKFEPSRLREGNWDEHRDAVAQQVIGILDRYAPNFRASLVDWIMYTPADIESRNGLTDGNIHHINHSAEQMLGSRLFTGGGHRTPIADLYMCGAGSHPGGEVTGAPGFNAAHAILDVTDRDSSRI
ncbi:MAG: hypothetical protein QOJ80_6323 [Mycobacterium sp.]|jgi:phytoene dehydrogenase-like protein|nr:hypothetical protein [Mycobacterium sp.]